MKSWSPAKNAPPVTAPAPSPPPPTPLQAKEISLKEVYFDYGDAALTSEAISTLAETVGVLKENPTISIELAGH